MASDLCSDDVVVCISSPQIISAESPSAGALRVATSTATVELGRRLLLAARAGDTPLVLDLMAKGAPFTTDWLGTSPLHLAASNAHAETCAVLLRAGFSRDARTKVQRTPLHLAAYGGHAAVVRLLLEAGAAPDCRDMLRMTPLHWAAQRGHARAAHELLRRGADPAARSKFHKTPLDIAAAARRDDLVRLIEDAVKEREAAESVDALVNEQMAEAPATEPRSHRSVRTVDGVQRIDETMKLPVIKPAEKKAQIETNANSGNLKRDDLIKIIEDAIKDKGSTKTSDAGSTAVHEQLVDSPNAEARLQAFDPVQKLKEVKFSKLKQEKTNQVDTQVDGAEGAALLRSHGITLLPPDHSSTVLNALQSGRTVVLSDAGKLMLKESEGAAGARGVKVFTLNNKLLHSKLLAGKAAARDARPPVRKVIDPQDMQVKFVQLPPDAKIISPSKLVPVKCKPQRPAVKIIMNKNNFNRLVANTGRAAVVQGAADPSGSAQAGAQPPARSGSPRQLRAQLLAAHQALAALRAELAACKARLARYEPL